MQHSTRFVIKEITDKDFDPAFVPQLSFEEYRLRKAARGIVSYNGKIALLHATKPNYHKLPGGGIEIGENAEEAFKREILEETGAECEILDIDGQDSVTLETLEAQKLVQISHIFWAKVIGTPTEVNFTQDELDEGFTLKWVTIEEAEELLANAKPTSRQGHFVNTRDKAVIQFFKNRLE